MPACLVRLRMVPGSLLVFLSLSASLAQELSGRLEPPPGQRCSGRNFQGRRCCTPENPCDEGEGDCDGPGDGGQHDGHAGCKGDLVCGSNNCLQFGAYYHPKDDCCEKPNNSSATPSVETPFNPFKDNIHPTYFRPIDKRCGGRNVDKGVCCTPDTPCTLGEGDCENDSDCQDDLVCGNNNCKQFAAYFHKKDDCCVKPDSSKSAINSIFGQRCSGRNFQGRRCCTPENPCDEGEGDCDGPADGGQHDGHAGCKGDLICGSNNCKKFGHYYHEKDDCCERP